MANKFFAKLMALEGAVKIGEYDPLLNCLTSPSPSINWSFGLPGHGLPFGYSMILYGPPKGGKSLICNAFISQLHQDDPEALAVYFNTELRGELQMNQSQMKTWNIDPQRCIVYDVNQPEMIFDRIERDIDALCQEGAKIRVVVIDSLKGILGRRMMNAESVNQQLIGDEAATTQDGLKRIIPVIRKHKIALLMTQHIRAEMDQREQMRGHTIKMGGAYAQKHLAEIFAYVERNQNKDGKTSLLGEDFSDPEIKDFMDKNQKTGHKIRFRVEDSSLGINGRTAEFTLDYGNGIVNTFEEVFTLGCNLGIIERPNNQMYKIGDQSYRGAANMLTAIRDNSVLYRDLLIKIYNKDLELYNAKLAK